MAFMLQLKDGKIKKKIPVHKKLVQLQNIYRMTEWKHVIPSKRNQKAMSSSYNHIWYKRLNSLTKPGTDWKSEKWYFKQRNQKARRND